MSSIQSFTGLHAWQEAHKLVLLVYKATEHFPSSEAFALTNQLRRAAVSITSNTAEGFSRRSSKEKAQFYSTALGSLTEIQNQILIGRDVGYIQNDSFDTLASQSIVVSKLINGLLKAVRNRIP